MRPDNTYISLTEKDFLDEIYTELRKISEEKYTETYPKVFTFYDSQAQPTLENKYMAIAKKFERIGVLNSVGIFYKKPHSIEFSVYLIPKDFIDFYHEKYNTTIANPKENEKNRQPKKTKNIAIEIIEILEDKTGDKRISIYINVDYLYPRKYGRGKNWELMYELADQKIVSYDKSFFDYFNSSKLNPLYAKEGFKVTKILRQENGSIVPNITIKLVTQKALTQRLKTA